MVRFFFKLNTKIANIFFIIIIFYGLFNSRIVLQDNTGKILNSFYYNFSNQYFQDVYQENINRLSMTRDKFRLVSQKALSNAGVKEIKVQELKSNLNNKEGKVKIKIEYLTQDFGSFSEIKEIKLLKNNGKWKISWDWNMILNGFLPSYAVKTERILGRRGAIVASNGGVLAQDDEGYLVLVNPEKIDLKKEPKMLDFLSSIGNVEAPYLQNAYLENALPGTDVALFTLFHALDEKTKSKLLSFPGVKIVPYPAREYKKMSVLSIENTLFKECCTRIYSKNYHGIDGLEKKYDSLLSGSDGGSITINDQQGNPIEIVLEREAKIGQDVTSPL